MKTLVMICNLDTWRAYFVNEAGQCRSVFDRDIYRTVTKYACTISQGKICGIPENAFCKNETEALKNYGIGKQFTF